MDPPRSVIKPIKKRGRTGKSKGEKHNGERGRGKGGRKGKGGRGRYMFEDFHVVLGNVFNDEIDVGNGGDVDCFRGGLA